MRSFMYGEMYAPDCATIEVNKVTRLSRISSDGSVMSWVPEAGQENVCKVCHNEHFYYVKFYLIIFIVILCRNGN